MSFPSNGLHQKTAVPLLDTYRSVETPEGVELGLRVAGPPVRMLAWAVDTAVRLACYVALAIPLGLLGEVGQGAMLVVLFLGEWFYPVFFEVKWRGATPGKRQMGLVVLHDDGTPVGWTASVVRNLVRFADFLPVVYGFGLASMLVQRDFKRLGDLAAGTIVVHRDAEAPAEGLPEGPATPPSAPLRLAERRAIVEFARRLPTWTDERAVEIAEAALPLTGTGGQAGAERLVANARWLLGKR